VQEEDGRAGHGCDAIRRMSFRLAPTQHGAVAAAYVNPIPHGLMLTAIVVSVAITGVALALLIRIHRIFGTLDEPELLEAMKRPQ
jgi:multicomponent Na+:H+ antiporter subunit C